MAEIRVQVKKHKATPLWIWIALIVIVAVVVIYLVMHNARGKNQAAPGNATGMVILQPHALHVPHGNPRMTA